MGQSYRVRTGTGINKQITVQLDQEFEFLEILSLRIQQEEIYTRNCANYGVIVGRVTANNGFGLPNARVSVFIPIASVDESNPIISSIYPYKSTTDKNEDGYRYNLLPYEKSYSKHAATGTFPTRDDVLTGKTAVEIYDTYYKYTTKTNESGDYMIMGAPLGPQTLFMDVDLSDIGEFSLTPQDLIRMGLATESQVAGNQFKTSNDLNSLPQIISLTKTLEVSPLWGDETICQIAINRVDFDLRDEANVDIQPTAVFMGSIFSAADKMRIRPGVRVLNTVVGGCKPKDNLGNLCDLVSGPGQILAIRQTIQQDNEGNPILEQYQLEQAGNVIDGDGTWVTEVPMNLDYVITNEFGEKVVSNDPTIGIPTKGKYRFKIKWQQPNSLTQQTRRAYFLVPNVKEYGWHSLGGDPNLLSPTSVYGKELAGSYYFGLNWSGYTNAQAAINCEDTFYEFNYNRVYTVSSLIDQYKKGEARGRFIGIKEIDDDSCSSTTNKFPVNEGFRNFDLIFFLFSIIFQIIQLIGLPILIIYHFLAYLWNNFAVILLPLLILYFGFNAAQEFVSAAVSFPALGLIVPAVIKGVLWTTLTVLLIINFGKITKYKFGRFKIPMITYPDCVACDCIPETTSQEDGVGSSGALSLLSINGLYYNNLVGYVTNILGYDSEDIEIGAYSIAQAIGTRSDVPSDNNIFRSTESAQYRFPSSNNKFFAFSSSLPLAERINVFNTRAKYFTGTRDNRIGVTFDYNSNIGKNHYDNTLTVLGKYKLEAGTLVTFVDPTKTTDVNYLYTASTVTGGLITGIDGIPLNPGQSTYTVEYAETQSSNNSVVYVLSTGSTESNYKFPMDLEYYQVLTAITISQAALFWQVGTSSSENKFSGILDSSTSVTLSTKENVFTGWDSTQLPPLKFSNYFDGFNTQYIVIYQRGVDPYSPKYINKYGVGKLFGFDDEYAITFTANTRLNIPIQSVSNPYSTVQNHSEQGNIFYESHFFRAGDKFEDFKTQNIGYYSSLDAQRGVPYMEILPTNRIVSVSYNAAYDANPNPGKYDNSEDLSGGSFYYIQAGNRPDNTVSTYYSPSLLPIYTATPLNIQSKVLNVMRTDRLPSSDYLSSSSWTYNPSILQQNTGFNLYIINTDTEDFTSENLGSGADTISPDIEGQLFSTNVIDTVGTCANMVGLSCYSGNGETFGVKDSCNNTDTVENGCYVFMEKPLTDLKKDLKSFAEWGFRFRFFYGLCRGVLSQTFTNNWINGTLFMFPIQTNVFFDKKNQPLKPEFCLDLIYFDVKTNNFYYRSSPYYSGTTQPFIGLPKKDGGINDRNLLFPTTIVNLGMKDSFYQEIMFEPSAKAYIIDKIDSTSYGDTSDLVNLFVISRITDENFLQQIISAVNPNKNNSLNQLFTRPQKRVDGDLTQLLSINSEEGVIKFSQEYYTATGLPTDPVTIFGPLSSPTMGVFFSSTTEDLQFKDYLTPGRIDFRDGNNLYPYQYGIKSQEVPFYQWGLDNTDTIFGSQYNNWKTSNSLGIFSKQYQSLDRTNLNGTSKYFIGSNTDLSDTFARGYIFNVDATSPTNFVYSKNNGSYPNIFLIGAPFHFYFGITKGLSALDKFKTKYSIVE